MRVRLTALFAAIGGLAYAQLGSVAGPSAGYVFDSSVQAVRQIRGLAGAATMGDPLDFGMPVVRAEISARGDLAVAIAADGSGHLFRLANGVATGRALDNLMSSPTSVVFSPSGTAAALYRAGSVQVLRGLPDAPEIAVTMQLTSASGAGMASAAPIRRVIPGAMAVSDDAAFVLLARDNSIELFSVAGGVRKLADAHAGAAVAFASGGHDAAVVSGGTLSVFQDVSGPSTRQEFPAADSGASLAFSADGAKLLIAGPRSVTVLDRATGDRKLAPCDCRIGSLARMGAMFRLNEAGSGPLWLLDPSGAEPRILFVPARPSL